MKQLGMFAKYWLPGTVKTRLAAAIGSHQASRVYQVFLRTLTQRMRTVGDHRTIVFTPREHRADFEAFAAGGWSLEPQSEGDLGHRMSQFFASSLARDQEAVVLIGSDSPTLPVNYIERAFETLQDFPVVLGPSGDGGYYLIGASRETPPVFADIAWSSHRVWDQTVAALRQADCAYASLPEWYDVDDIQGLRRLRTELAETANDDDESAGLLEAIDALTLLGDS